MKTTIARYPTRLTSTHKADGARLDFHPITAEFPKYTQAECVSMTTSFRLIGQAVPAVIWNGQVVDGRHRYETNIELEQKMWKTMDISDLSEAEMREYVIALNLERRNLTDDQRAAISARLIEGRKMSVRDAAKEANVSKEKIQRVKKVKEAAPDLLEEVVDGKKTLAEAEHDAGLKPGPAETPPAASPGVVLRIALTPALIEKHGLASASGSLDKAKVAKFCQPITDAAVDLDLFGVKFEVIG